MPWGKSFQTSPCSKNFQKSPVATVCFTHNSFRPKRRLESVLISAPFVFQLFFQLSISMFIESLRECLSISGAFK